MAETAREDWPWTVAEFEDWHARQPDRWEFVFGAPKMMAPATMRHSVIKRNLARLLDRQLEGGPCEVLVDGPQIRTEEISAIPDLVVTCSPLDFSTPVIAEPAIIIEVMSPSSEADDHGLKMLAYRRIPSLRHDLVVAQHEPLIVVHSRAGDLWHERFVAEGSIALEGPPLRLELSGVYASTDLVA